MQKLVLLTAFLIAGIVFFGGCVKSEDQSQKLIGNERDEHGCLGPAGYTWCEQKQKCLRTWEEKCE